MMFDPSIADAPAVFANRPAIEWPAALECALNTLPKRWVFRNDRVNVLLVGLQGGETLVLGPWSQCCLLVITFGRVNLVTDGHSLCLNETDSAVVVPGAQHELQAVNAADFLLLNVTVPIPWANRCLCHSPAGREETLAAAARRFRNNARV
ncbi:MAG: hypothetical protein L0Y58_16645 [Verrucomicrobia subdivision 3 bacterium]|nr:hypothetical protein [Limisphaerales bacterium]